MHTPLESYLHQMIQENGPIPFDRFMNEALYHPQWGYYESKQTLIGKEATFKQASAMDRFSENYSLDNSWIGP